MPETWFSGKSADYVEDVLRGIDHRLIDPKAINNIVTQQQRGASNMKRIFALCIFELWRRQYNVALPV